MWLFRYFIIANNMFSTAFTPLFGQLCNIFGRRWIFLIIIAIFKLGSGICGGASTGEMLIAGRATQGAGSGGIVLTVRKSKIQNFFYPYSDLDKHFLTSKLPQISSFPTSVLSQNAASIWP
jgi:MFS family permease